MTAKVGVLIVHGMGSQAEDFSKGIIDDLSDKLGDKVGSVCWEKVWWAPVATLAFS